MGRKKGKRRGLPDGRKNRTESPLDWERDIEGSPKASGVAENPRGYRQGVGGGVELPMGTYNPVVEELPREGKPLE